MSYLLPGSQHDIMMIYWKGFFFFLRKKKNILDLVQDGGCF